MMRYLSLSFLVLAICCIAFQAGADEEKFSYSGQIEAGGQVVHRNGDEAKFNEYRDLDDGLYGAAEVQANKEDIYFILNTEEIGQDDQEYEFKGGKYGKFKFSVYYNELPHYYTRSAKSYLNGVGSANLTDSGNQANPNLWQVFDYDKKRKNAGFEGEYNFKTPYYVEFGASQRDSEGIYPLGGPSGTELPAPIDWEEQSWFVGAGYQSRSIVTSLRVDISDFDNANEQMNWDTHTTSLAPDSEFSKFSGKLIYRNPFLSSQYSLKVSHSTKENTVNMALMDSSVSGMYNGDVTTTLADIAWDFEPASFMDMKLYAGYSDTDDDSDELTVNSVTIEPYDHEKKQVGFDTTFTLPKANYLDAGYRYTDAERSSRTDNDNTKDSLTFLQYRTRSIDRFTFRARYEYLNRNGDFNGTDGYEYVDGTNSYSLLSTADDGTRRYDVADQIRNKVALEAGYSFTDQLSGTVEYAWWDRDYEDTIYGLTGMEHNEVYVSADFYVPNSFSVSVYLGYEFDENKLSTDRDWSQIEEFDTITYGVMLELPKLIDRLHLSLSWDHSMVNGSTDFSSTAGASYENLTDVDDCTTQRFEAKGTYSLNRSWDIKAGYTFEKFNLDDGQYDGYTYLPSGATLTGAYAEQDYESHLVYLGVAYRF